MRKLLGFAASVLIGTSAFVGAEALGPAVAASPVAAGRAGLPPGTEFAAFDARVLTRPAPVTGTDGFVHIAYELVLTNVTPVALRITSVEVRNARTGRVLLSLAGSRLDGNVNAVGVAGAPETGPAPSTTTVDSSEAVIVWLDVRVRGWPDVPAILDHRVAAALVSPPPGAPSSIASVLAPVATCATSRSRSHLRWNRGSGSQARAAAPIQPTTDAGFSASTAASRFLSGSRSIGSGSTPGTGRGSEIPTCSAATSPTASP